MPISLVYIMFDFFYKDIFSNNKSINKNVATLSYLSGICVSDLCIVDCAMS
jgi:hypothetical protein